VLQVSGGYGITDPEGTGEGKGIYVTYRGNQYHLGKKTGLEKKIYKGIKKKRVENAPKKTMQLALNRK